MVNRKERNDLIWHGGVYEEEGNTACFLLGEMSEVNDL